MSSETFTPHRLVPTNETHGVIALLAKEGLGVVGRYVPEAGCHASTPPATRWERLADCVTGRPEAPPCRPLIAYYEKYKNRGNELSNSFKTGNLRFFNDENELKTNSI
jgi:hypothetical protein